jgi:hypothetical protein
VNLFYLSDVRFGGWPTFTAHLMMGLAGNGIKPRLFRVAKHTEGFARDFGFGIRYQNISLDRALEICGGGLIVVAAPKRWYERDLLMMMGACLVVHDPTEVKGDAAEGLKQAPRVFTVRRENLTMLTRLGATNPTFQPHPYRRCGPLSAFSQRMTACSISRIDFDKHIDVILEANELLTNGFQVDIYGAENRLYTHHKLGQQWPDWRKSYKGQFDGKGPWGGFKIARHYRTMVDMSAIAGDGGGTQYTHLEAMDAGADVILNAAWQVAPTCESDQYASLARDARELAALVQRDDDDELLALLRSNYDSVLKKHDAKTIADNYVALIRGT